MLVCFTFRAKAGHEKEFERLLASPDGGRAVARAMGATRNTLFLSGGRMVRVLEFPDGVTPRTMTDLAREDPRVMAFLRELAPHVEDGFDPDRLDTLDAFNARHHVGTSYDVRV